VNSPSGQKRVEEALARGEYAPFETRTGLIFTFSGVLLGIGTVAVILAQPGQGRTTQRKPMWLVDVSTASAWRAAGR